MFRRETITAPSTRANPQEVPRLALRVDEAAESAGLSRSKLYQEMALGHLRFVKCGARRLIPLAELEAFLARLGGVA
jgi:excisionase family DNA binding protein